MKVSVEVCVTSMEEALAAERAGVDTIEVCNWPECGGITPSFGFLNLLQERVKLRKRVLVRPAPGGSQYSADERQVLLRDVMMCGVGDADCGIVSGGLDEQDLPDVELVKGIVLAAGGREVTFHRALDLASDVVRGFEIVMALGVHRVLTSGGHTRAQDGASVLAELVRRAGDRVTVAAAGGINAENVVELVERTGVREVHFAAQRVVSSRASDKPALSSSAAGRDFATRPDEAKIEAVLMALTKAGMR